MEGMLEIFRNVKEICEKTDCEKCPFSIGVYQEGLDYTYYFCDLKKKPREWDIDKKRVKQDKDYKKNNEKKEKEKEEKKPKKRGRKKKEAKNDNVE